MPMLIAKVTLLFLAALITLLAAKRATAAMRHLLCVCALAGSLILPLAALFPARVITIRLTVIDAVMQPPKRWRGRKAGLPPSVLILAGWAFGCLMLDPSSGNRSLAGSAAGPRRHSHQAGESVSGRCKRSHCLRPAPARHSDAAILLDMA